jgi:hypothetical protein
MAEGKRTAIAVVKEYFGEGSRPVSNGELIALKKGDPEALRQLADGIEDGTFTY